MTDAESMGMLFDDPPDIPENAIPTVHAENGEVVLYGPCDPVKAEIWITTTPSQQ